MKSCKTGKHLPPASPDLYYPVFPGPKLKVINGEIVVTNDKKDVIRSIGPEAKSVFSEFSGSTLADGKGEQITSRPRMASIQSSTNFGKIFLIAL